jgi:hypothetical protein
LLYSIDGDEGAHPAASWLSKAETLIEAIGVEPFRASLTRWFEPLQRGRPQRLSREGSFLLRSFIWLAASLHDAALSAKIGEICEVDFKPKSNAQKVIRAAAEATGKPDPTPQPAVRTPSFDSLLSRAFATALSPINSVVSPELAGRIEVGEQVVHVRGDLDTYQVHLSTGAIFRDSDGKQVYIAASAPRLPVTRVPDVAGMAQMLGHILLLAEDAKHSTSLVAMSE